MMPALTSRNAMRRTVLTWILSAVCFAGAADAAEIVYDDVPQKDTPRSLQEAWLRFHEKELCQDVDAAFVFVDGGVQIWSRITSDKSNLKFQELFAPLASLHAVKLYANRAREENEGDGGDNPPPSLWQNSELRANLGDRAAQLSVYKEDQITINPAPPDPLLKQRLLIFAEQTLNRNRKMEHYALDLFALARLADDSDIAPDIRSKAVAICSAHAKSLEKNIGKLASDLEQAIPRSEKAEKRSVRPGDAGRALNEAAERIYKSAQAVAARIHRFIYPEYYTVELRELRDPSLFKSMRTLELMVLDFQKTLSRSSRKQAGRDAR